MMLASEPLTHFINRHPTIKMLALSFLLLIGMILIADGLHFDIPRGYLYFAVCFSLFVEALNSIIAKKKQRSHPLNFAGRADTNSTGIRQPKKFIVDY